MILSKRNMKLAKYKKKQKYFSNAFNEEVSENYMICSNICNKDYILQGKQL